MRSIADLASRRPRLFRRSATRAPDPAVLGPYTRHGYWHYHQRLGLTLLGLIAAFYGFFYGITTTFFLVQLSVPLVVLALLIIWALPDVGAAPTRRLERLFFAFFVALFCWPDYLALALPGLPWITAVRIVVIPLTIVFLTSLSQSREFRLELREIMDAIPAVWKLMFAFSILALVGIAWSGDMAQSANKYVVAMVYWVQLFFVAIYVFAQPRRIVTFAFLLWFAMIVVCLIGVVEAYYSAVPWAGHIPGFLKIEDPTVARIMAGSVRAASGIYRVQSKFTTPLGLAEFISYATPFIVHLAFVSRNLTVRVAAVATLPLIVYIVVKTDARLGMVGLFSTALLYTLFWAAQRWRNDRDSIVAPALVIGFPAIGAAFLASTFLVGRIGKLVWGSGAQSYSSAARQAQVADGLPKILSEPWGYGIGMGGRTLGYTNLAGIPTIDTYYLSIALELGVIGFLIYYGMFVVGIVKGALAASDRFDLDTSFIGPVLIALVNFVIIKSILSQVENHPLPFALLGAAVALVYRIRRHHAAPQQAQAQAPPQALPA